MTKQEEIKPNGWHLVLVLALLGLGAWVLVERAWTLHVVDHDFLANEGSKRNTRVQPLTAYRGVIKDRAGRPLAVSTPVTTLWGEPAELLENRAAWERLKGNKVLSDAVLAQRVELYRKRNYVYLARRLAPSQAQSVLSKNIPGIYTETEYRRYYPAGEVTSHLVGFTNIDDRGQEGLELMLDERLNGISGRKKVVRDLKGRVIQDIEVQKEARPGEDIELSIDLRLQYIAYRELKAAVEKYQAVGGSVVVLDARTGEILAMVNQPGFNPNSRAGVSVSALRNRAVTDLFEPGSTIKPLTIAAGLEAGIIAADSEIDTTPGTMRIGRDTVRDFRNYGVMNIPAVLAKSSNVATSKIALELDGQELPSLMARFGLGMSTGVDFPGEAAGNLPIRQRWRDIEKATLSYGYGVSVSALQLARAYGVLANEGKLLPATLFKQEKAPEGEVVMAAEHANSIVKMLEGVVSEGTASRAQVPGYRIAGKTGTTRKLINGNYNSERYLAMFAGIAPVEDPRIVTVVAVDDPRSGVYYGGLVAAPVFANIMSAVLPMLNIEPEKTPVYAQGGQ